MGTCWERAIKTTGNMTRLSKENGAKSENLDIKSIWQAKDSHSSFAGGGKKKRKWTAWICCAKWTAWGLKLEAESSQLWLNGKKRQQKQVTYRQMSGREDTKISNEVDILNCLPCSSLLKELQSSQVPLFPDTARVP